uniref:Xylanase n=1 Tax=uncultured organism TaxID=155900 RepID=Q5I2C6_9ZZZZ|nr:xylanase [uncultured organism]
MTLSRRRFMLGTAAGLIAVTHLKSRAFAAALKSSGLKDLYRDDFLIGTVLSARSFPDKETTLLDLISREFNAVTAENAMKWEEIRPQLDSWQWDIADQMVDFATRHKMHMVGHTLVWHSQVPAQVFLDSSGQPLERDALLKIMKGHIETLVGRYKGRIATWDVVNEAIEDDGKWRQTSWFKGVGEDYIDHAFRFAHDVDPQAHLIYNDYNTFVPTKRDAIAAMAKKLKARGVPIHGLGMQGHIGIGRPDLTELEQTIEAFADAGMRVHITELDVDVLPSVWEMSAEIANRFEYKPEMDPYIDGFPQEMEEKLADRYEALFKIFLKHRDKIDRVTFWGTSDGASWLNGFPIPGRTNYPLLFNRQMDPKPAYNRLAALKLGK